MAFTRQKTLLTAASSGLTAGPYLMADFTQMTVSIVTQTNVASVFTVQMSNEDGLSSALAQDQFSHVTALSQQGQFGVETGPRWVQVLRPSASSATIAISGAVNR